MNLMFLTWTGVLDDNLYGPEIEGVVFKIWLKSNEYEGIKNSLKDG